MSGPDATRKRRGAAFVTQNACNECKRKRAKCDGRNPCGRCTAAQHGLCEYAISIRTSKEEMRTQIEALETYQRRSEHVFRHIATERKANTVLEQLREGNSLDTIYKSITGQTSDNDTSMRRSEPSRFRHISETGSQRSTSTMPEGDIRGDDMYDSAMDIETEWPQRGMSKSWTTVTPDSDLLKHLYSLYFCWEDPIIAIISKRQFLEDFDAGRHTYCSSLLVNVIAALGCRFSDRPIVTTQLAGGEKFYLKAQQIWENEHGKPCVTTIQATALMSIWEASRGRDQEGLFYAREAISMAIEVGLHIRHNNNNTPRLEDEVCNATFWGCFVLDQMWSLCTRQVPHLSRRGIFAMSPLIVDNAYHMDWTAYIDNEISPSGQSRAAQKRPEIQRSDSRSVLKGICELSRIVHGSLHILHSPRRALTNADVVSIYSHYTKWRESMVEVLQGEGNSTPAALFTQLLYHFSILLLFGPLNSLPLFDSDLHPAIICAQAADAIGVLVRSYRALYTLRRTPTFVSHISLAASMMHLSIAENKAHELSGTFTKVLQGVSDLHEMAPSDAFAGSAAKSLRMMANRAIAGMEPFMREAGDQPRPAERARSSLIERRSILPSSSIVLESSIFSPYMTQYNIDSLPWPAKG